MLAGMTSRELTEWHLYDALEGLPDKRDDLRAGTIASILANTRMGKRGKTMKPADFFPSLRPADTSSLDPGEALKAKFETIVATMNFPAPELAKPEAANDDHRQPDRDAGA